MIVASITIRDFKEGDQPFFERLNRSWIEQYFEMEPVDVMVLQQPDKYIIKKGGHILMANYENEIAGTVALKFVSPGVYEFTKMAVDENFRRRKIGQRLTEAAIVRAKKLEASSIILYSNRILEHAIDLYRKNGFTEVDLDGLYKRSDIKMQLILDY
jgi:ribosomal protein S18 acetylase RimI-like enzyme